MFCGDMTGGGVGMLNDCGEGACEFNESEKLDALQSEDSSDKLPEFGELRVPHGEFNSCIM